MRKNHNGHSLVPVPTPCGECGTLTELVNGDRMYPHRQDLAAKRFYRCPACSASIGTHPGTCHPLGTPANATTRSARSRAHAHFDALYKAVGRIKPEGGSPRKRAYRWLAGHLGIPYHDCHIGMMGREQAERVVEICIPELERLGVKPEKR